MRVALMAISSIGSNKVIESFLEKFLAAIICEVISFKVMNKDKVFNFVNISDLPAFINRLSESVFLPSCMCHYFSGSSVFATSCSYIVKTLNIKVEVGLSFDHFVVSLLVIIVLLHIVDVFFDVTATTCCTYVE